MHPGRLVSDEFKFIVKLECPFKRNDWISWINLKYWKTSQVEIIVTEDDAETRYVPNLLWLKVD